MVQVVPFPLRQFAWEATSRLPHPTPRITEMMGDTLMWRKKFIKPCILLVTINHIFKTYTAQQKIISNLLYLMRRHWQKVRETVFLEIEENVKPNVFRH